MYISRDIVSWSAKMEEEKTDLLGQQIKAFLKKVEICEKGFSVMKMTEMLLALKQRPAAIIYGQIKTMEIFRKIIHDETKLQNTALTVTTHADKQLIIYFKWFLDYFKYLSVLKLNFDSRIHKNLIQYFYDDSYKVPSSPSKSSYSESEVGEDATNEEVAFQTRYDSHIGDIIKLVNETYEQIGSSDADKNIYQIAAKMLRKSRRIENLLREDVELQSVMVPDFTKFQVTRYNQGYSTEVDLAVLVRLVPCILDCFYNIAQFAIEWLQWDRRRSETLQDNFQLLKELNRKVTERLMQVRNTIETQDRELRENEDDVQLLLRREERCNDLNSHLYEIEDSYSKDRQELVKAKCQRDDIARELKFAIKGSRYETELIEQHDENQSTIEQLVMNLKLQAFRKSIIEQDIDVETEVKPSMIIFTNDVQEKCEKLELLLARRRGEVQKLEEILNSIQNDRQKVESEILKQTMLRNRRESVILTDFPDIILDDMP